MSSTSYPLDRLYHEVTGPAEGPPVLLLHGWGSSAALMQSAARALAGTYRVYNVDLPGHGHSPPPPEAWGVPEHAALVGRFLDAVVGQPVAVVGHSNGGRIALFMASDGDLRRHVRALVLVSPSGVTPVRTWRYHVKRNVAQALKAPFELLPEGQAKDYALDWLRHSLVWKLLGSSDYRALEGVMRETFVKTVSFHLEDRLPHIQVPVLLFWGTADAAISRHQMRVLETRIPDAGLVPLDGAGHYGYLDDPDTFAAATRHFLADVYELQEM